MSVHEVGCPLSEPDLHEFVAGELDGPRALLVSEHLAACDRCRERALRARMTAASLRALDPTDVVRWHRFESPFGRMYAAATSEGLARVTWSAEGVAGFEAGLARRYPGVPLIRDRSALERVEEELEEYFEGKRRSFDVPVDLGGLGAFQKSVLTEAARIPYGEVIPYAELARRIDRPRAARAVGNALGANPVAIVVPCHRIVSSDGGLGGYTGGREFKRALLGVEGHGDLFAGVDR